MTNDNEALEDICHEAAHLFFIPDPDDILLSSLDDLIRNISAQYRPIAQAFKYNLESAISTLAMPSTLAFGAAHLMRYRQILNAERIRNRNPDTGEVDNETALKIASQRLEEELKSEEAINRITYVACNFLCDASGQQGLKQASEELLRQGILLLWGAFEVVSRDVFTLHVNNRPDLAQALAQDERTSKLFQLKGLAFSLLAEHGYNVSSSMGNILASLYDLSNLATIRKIYGVLFPERPRVHEALAQSQLWVLFQRRNLIVHQRGIVDEKYLQNTGDTVSLGTVLIISPHDIERCLLLVGNAGKELLTAGSDLTRNGPASSQSDQEG